MFSVGKGAPAPVPRQSESSQSQGTASAAAGGEAKDGTSISEAPVARPMSSADVHDISGENISRLCIKVLESKEPQAAHKLFETLGGFGGSEDKAPSELLELAQSIFTVSAEEKEALQGLLHLADLNIGSGSKKRKAAAEGIRDVFKAAAGGYDIGDTTTFASLPDSTLFEMSYTYKSNSALSVAVGRALSAKSGGKTIGFKGTAQAEEAQRCVDILNDASARRSEAMDQLKQGLAMTHLRQ